jgi:hypothetical protein
VRLTLDDTFPCDAARFWELYFDTDYTLRLHREALGSTSAEVTERTGDLSTGLTRTLRYGQRPDMPGPVKRLFGDEVTTTEVSTFDPATGTSSFDLTPGTLADKTHIAGSITVTDDGDGCRQQFMIEARVKIFGAGPVVERFIERQARDVQAKAVAYMKAELAGEH